MRIHTTLVGLAVLGLAGVSAMAKDKGPTIEEKILAEIQDKPVDTWHEFVRKHDNTCIGPKELINKPEEHEVGGKKYRYSGYRVDVLSPDKDDRVVLGLLGATKNFLPATQQNLKQLAETFKQRKVEAVLVLGDIAYVGKEIREILTHFAEHLGDTPILVIIGNAESRGPFGRALRDLALKRDNVFNLNIVRVFNGDDFSVVSIPGYYDKRFVEGRASCVYRKQHMKNLKDFVAEATGPIVFASHGPPLTTGGKQSIDGITGGKNVGCKVMAKAIEHFQVPFGAYSHILEAGGSAWSFLKSKPVKPKKWSKSLHVNTGAANALDWELNTGKVSQGLGTILTIKGDKARYEMIYMSHPPELDEDDEWGGEFDFDE